MLGEVARRSIRATHHDRAGRCGRQRRCRCRRQGRARRIYAADDFGRNRKHQPVPRQIHAFFDPDKVRPGSGSSPTCPCLCWRGSSTEIKSLQDLIANAKANPRKLKFRPAVSARRDTWDRRCLLMLRASPCPTFLIAVRDLPLTTLSPATSRARLIIRRWYCCISRLAPSLPLRWLPQRDCWSRRTFRQLRGWAAELGGFLAVASLRLPGRPRSSADCSRRSPRPCSKTDDVRKALRKLHAGERQYARGISNRLIRDEKGKMGRGRHGIEPNPRTSGNATCITPVLLLSQRRTRRLQCCSRSTLLCDRMGFASGGRPGRNSLSARRRSPLTR